MKWYFTLGLAACLPLFSQVRITQGSDRIIVDVEGKPFTEFFTSADTTKPYLYPLLAASGTGITRNYPMKIVAGESHDHIHHRGCWFSHGSVNGIDFWANDPSQQGPKKGTIRIQKIVALKSGKKAGTVAAIFEWVDYSGKPILTENRVMRFYSNPTLRIIDFDIKLTAIGDVTFGDTKEGTFAIRLAAPLEERRSGRMVNAQGLETEKNVWGKRSEWVDYYGEIGGEKLGVAIFDHPSNPRHPTWWHSRAYGLFAANPFGQGEFEKSGDGSMRLRPGQTIRFRYRVLIHPGDVKTADVAAEYKKFAAVK